MKEKALRIVQLIDSLETGGAERMAVNYANSLQHNIAFSGLVVTRKEGSLGQLLYPQVEYAFLNKKSTFDWGAIWRLRSFCVQHSVYYIHAHSTSWFLAVCVRLLLPSVKIIWHDHYGSSEFLDRRPAKALRFGSYFFSGILSVNEKLAQWGKQKLRVKSVLYLPNFFQLSSNANGSTLLHGQNGKRVLLLANLRPQKNQFLLLEALSLIEANDWTFHLVGKDFQDDYSARLRQSIIEKQLDNKVFLYGAKDDVPYLISNCEIGLLTSDSEGLPVALLEYGSQAKAVVVTAVGEIPSIVSDGRNGKLVPPRDAARLASAISALMADAPARERLGNALKETVTNGYSEAAVVHKYVNWIKSL